MIYRMSFLKENLVYIEWESFPSTNQVLQFLQELERMLNEATCPLYFLSDLRRGYILQTHLIHRLGDLSTHPNFGGGTAFSEVNKTNAFLRLWKQFTGNKNTSQTWPRLEDALEYLEGVQPGLTQGIDWKTVVK